MGERQTRVVRLTGTVWIPPAARGRSRPRPLPCYSLAPRGQNVLRACSAGRSRSPGGRVRRGSNGCSGGRPGTAALLVLRDNSCLGRDPAGHPWAAERRASQTAAEDIRHHTGWTALPPARHLLAGPGIKHHPLSKKKNDICHFWFK